ncbi:hypothetical protein [Streptomyces sp. NBC_00316]|uniref:hypothetical protein n=1 Tax=Streptomyces sp. NBC_00316 TaxID=2975710 RepID=UPI002E2B9458|nr:hypothetical protein [Streptomyces sp. NBC_00316]
MEQRIDPKTQPAYAAGTDPAYIPGLTAPSIAGAPDAEQEKTQEPAPVDAATEGPAAGEAAVSGEAPDVAEATARDDGEKEGEEKVEQGEKAADGPVFEVSDRRGSITADRDGVRFTLDDQEADFRWDEIGAVEVKVPRFGRRFTVTVHMSTRRWFNAEVEAAARSSLKEWEQELDAVLDAYFEE